MKRDRYAWVTILPTFWLLLSTLTAGWQKLFDANPRVGFLAHAAQYQQAIAQGQVLAPAQSLAEMRRVVFNDYVNASMCSIFILVMLTIVIFGFRAVLAARAQTQATSQETPFEPFPRAATEAG
jgi:carbon starvation protein